MIERTLSLIKPDAVQRNLTGEILAMIQGAGLKVVALKMIHMTKAQAEGFYAVHRERPFFDSLTNYMSSGPVVCSILEGEDAIHRYRELMGATNPERPLKGRSARNTRSASRRTPCTVPTRRKRRLSKPGISSARLK